MYITAGVRGLSLAVPVGTASFVLLRHSTSNKCLFGDISVVHRWCKYSTKQWLVHVHILTVVSVIIVSVITVVVIAYYDEDTTTLTWISSLVSDVTIARSIVVVMISSIIPEIVHIEYVKTRTDNDHE